MKKIWLLLLSVSILSTGCSMDVGFSSAETDKKEEASPWYEDLTSRVDKEKGEKLHVKSKKSKSKRHRRHMAEKDLITPKKVDRKPVWVDQLQKKVHKVHIDGKAQVRKRHMVNDTIVTKKPERAPWVDTLKKKVETPALYNKSKHRSVTRVQTDMVGTRVRSNQRKVDIIFSVDTSESMYEFLTDAKHTFRGFTTELADLDWRIFFVNADYGQNGDHLFSFNSPYGKGQLLPLEDDGELLYEQSRYLSKQVKNHGLIFLDTISHHRFDEYSDYGGNYVSECDLAPGCGGWNEQPLSNLKAALVQNRDMFRADADKAVIVISDNDEGVNQTSNVGQKVSPADIFNVFKKLYGDNRWVAYGVVVPTGDQECRADVDSGIWSYIVDGFDSPDHTSLTELAKLTDGVNFSMCSKSYKPLANKIVADFK